MAIRNFWKMYFLFLTILCIPFSHLVAQNKHYTTDSQEAIGYYKSAYTQYRDGDGVSACSLLRKAIKTDSAFMEAYLLYGEILDYYKRYDDVLKMYSDAVRINGKALPASYYLLAETEMLLKMPEKAKIHYGQFLATPGILEKYKYMAEKSLAQCQFAIRAMANPVPFNPVNLGKNVNSEFSEYLPALTADEQTLYITVRLPGEYSTFSQTSTVNEDFYVCYKSGDTWTKAVNMGRSVNSPQNEGAQTITADGQYFYYTVCGRPECSNHCDIYFSHRDKGGWIPPKTIGMAINSGNYEGQPSVSADGKVLYFASDRPGGFGQLDIWKSEQDKNGYWSRPVNLGDSINTPEAEKSPFIHSDNKTLYFCSTGWPGMGGFDLFFSRMDDKGNWGTPQNMGYPINSMDNETSLIVNASGDKAYYSANRPGGLGESDLYEFELYEKARPTKVTYVKGIVYDSLNKTRLEAKLELIELESAHTVMLTSSNPADGKYLVCLPVEKNYALNVERDGYLFFSENFSLKNLPDKAKPYELNVPLIPIRIGGKVILKNIFFETDSYELMPESKAELNKLILFMEKNPALQIEISGHTDNTGDIDHNLKLSENRAKTVYEYLIAHSVKKERLTYAGYGETQPIDTNDTEQGKANNRRTEFKIVKTK